MAKPLDPKNTVGIDPYTKQAYAPIPVQTYVNAAADPGTGSVYAGDLDGIPAIYSRANVFVNQINQTQVTRNTNLISNVTGGVTSIVAGDNIIVSSTGPDGTGAVTINAADPGPTNPFDQDLNTFDDVEFNSVATPLITLDQQDFNITIQSGQGTHWIATYGDGLIIDQDYDYASSVVYDSAGNIIFFGGADTTDTVLGIVKLSPAGNIIWQKTLNNSNYCSGDALSVDSDDNLYLTGYESSGDSDRAFLIKLNSAGEILWQQYIDNAPTGNEAGTDIAIASSGSVYVLAFISSDESTSILLKFTNSGSLVWTRKLAGLLDINSGLSIDSNEHLYIVTSYGNNIILLKINSNGNIIWQREIIVPEPPYLNNGQETLVIDSEDFGYITFTSVINGAPGTYLTYLLKFDPSGTIIWQREVVMPGSINASDLAIDSSNNIYLGINHRNANNDFDVTTLKFNSNGLVAWQRTLNSINSSDEYWWWYYGVNNIAASDTGYSICGYQYTEGSGEIFVTNLAADGSGTGTHGPFIYSEASVTVNEISLTSTDSTIVTTTIVTPDISTGDFAVSDADKVYQLYLVSLPEYIWSYNANGSFGPTTYKFPYSVGSTGQVLSLNENNLLEWTTPSPLKVDGNNNIYIDGITDTTVDTGGRNLALGIDTRLTGNWNNFIGFGAGQDATGGFSNNFIGSFAGKFNTTGAYNNFIGYDAGRNNTNGAFNNFIGYLAGSLNTTGANNNFIGDQAGYSNTTGISNSFIGTNAGYSNTTGNSNTFIGNFAGYFNTTGSQNQFIGQEAGYSNTGSNNVFIGDRAGRNNTTASQNVFVGPNCGYSNTTGFSNSFYGEGAGRNNTSGYGNTFLGHQSGYNSNTGILNTFVGLLAGRDSATSSDNSMFGAYAGMFNTTGNRNVFLGALAGYSNTTGNNNNFIGHEAGRSSTTGFSNIFVGRRAGENNTTGFWNIYIGESAGRFISTGSTNISIGYTAGEYNQSGNDNVFIGTSSGRFNSTGYGNNFIGQSAGTNHTTGWYNNFFGFQPGFNSTTGYYNNFIGYFAGYSNTTAYYNNFIGFEAGRFNTTGQTNNFIGYQAGRNVTTGSNNTIIGGLTGSSTLSNTVLIGAGTTERVKVDATGLYINGSYAVNLVAVPTSSIGQAGDVAGRVAANATYFYYCTGTYNGTINIWKRIAWSADTW
jgi:hypothetical protein